MSRKLYSTRKTCWITSMTGLPKALRELCGIYIFINRVNGKCYVGSSNKIRHRFCRHLRNAKSGSYDSRLYQSIRDFGIDSFDFEIIELCEKEKLAERERFFMVLYDCVKNGYNTVPIPFSPRYDFSPPAETRKKLSVSGLGRKHSMLTRLKISAGNIGRVHTQETKDAIGKIHRGKILTPDHRASISAIHKGVSKSLEHRMKISAAHKGRPKPSAVVEKIKLAMSKMSPEARERINAARRKQVEKLSTKGEVLEIYRDAKEAAKAVGLAGPCGIHRCILGKLKLSAGYKWRWHSI